MNKPKKYSLNEVFENTTIGLIFEFYSSKDTQFIIKDLNRLTVKNIVLTNRDDYIASFGNAILLKEYEGKKPRYSFKMAQQDFHSMIPILKEVNEWLSVSANCTYDTALKVSLSFNHKNLQTLKDISGMIPTKLILGFNEDYIYKRFPKQKYSPYALSIEKIIPLNEQIYTNDIFKNINHILNIPKTNYYGINFENYTRGILEFNYIGGKDYSEKEQEIIELIEYYILKTYQSLNEESYTKDEIRKIREITENFNKIDESFYEPEKFVKHFPDIKLTVDLRRDKQLLLTYWSQIRSQLFEMVLNNGFSKGEFNYDTQEVKFQLRNAKINSKSINNFDLMKCDIGGVIENCDIWNCNIDKARIYNSKIVKGTTINDSYLNNVSVNYENNLERCFVENFEEILNCNIRECVVKFAAIGKQARLDEHSVIVDRDKINIQPAKGIEIEEIRDYKWIQGLIPREKTKYEYGNEYVRKRK